MTPFASLTVTNNDPVNTVRDFLARLLSTHTVTGVLVPVVTGNGRFTQPVLITDVANLAQANPLLPIMPVNMARMATLITRRFVPADNGNSSLPRIAVVMRPCELRATVELAKLNQIAFDQLLTIGVDCIGTVETNSIDSLDHLNAYLDNVLEMAAQGSGESPDGLDYRHACTICTNPVPWQADISLHTIGLNARQEILVEVRDDRLMDGLELEAGANPVPHQEAVEHLIASRQAQRTRELDAYAGQLQAQADGGPRLLAEFENCQRCFNCTVACPICYCKECLFRSNTFEHAPDHYLDRAEHKGIMRLPGDTVTFQLTRLAHISTSCVGCGVCTSACPADLPVDTLFQTVARQTQTLFDYVPGRDLDEPLPVARFDVDEFQDLGERVISKS